jgi:hypothetical protein
MANFCTLKAKKPSPNNTLDARSFVDHATTYIHHANQVSLCVGETLKAKHTFEGKAREWGHKIKKY